jgi:AraC family transcriptional regulator
MSEIKKVKVHVDSFNPRILSCYQYTEGLSFSKGYKLPRRRVFDYEIELFTYSEGSMLIDDKLYQINKGDIVFRKPGQYTEAIMPYACYFICFDLTNNTNKCPDNYDFCSGNNENNDFQDYYINDVLESIPSVFHPHGMEKYLEIFRNILEAFNNKTDESHMIMKICVLQLINQLYQECCNYNIPDSVASSPYAGKIRKAAGYISKNFNQQLSLDMLAGLCELSPSHFHKIFKNLMNITPNEYISKVRIEKAKELLKNSDMHIYKIAEECGFQNPPYFSYLFKKKESVAPEEFRKRYGL